MIEHGKINKTEEDDAYKIWYIDNNQTYNLSIKIGVNFKQF